LRRSALAQDRHKAKKQEELTMAKIELVELVEKMNLKNMTPDVDYSGIYLEEPDVNRLALQLTGYFEHFDNERVQIIGYLEYNYMQGMT
jgi:HPr kinase/phosphorylase